MISINIFIPEAIKYIKSGYLSGKYLAGDDAQNQEQMIIIDNTVNEIASEDSIGVISSQCITRAKKNSHWIVVETAPSFFLSSVVIDGKMVNVGNVNIVFYSATEIQHSYLLSNSNLSNNNFSNNIHYFIKRVKMEGKREKYSFKSQSRSNFMNLVIKTYILITNFITVCLKNINDILIKKFDAKSHSMHQFTHRIKQIRKFCECFHEEEDLVAKRIAGVLFCDILLGFLSFYFIYNWTSALELQLWFHSSTKIVAGNVQDLLGWLRGAPAGLKLNQPLAESLAAFFSYHVYLWTLYLEVASPVLAIMAHLFVFVGLLGISIQIALLTDFLNLAVMHIHCFYIYAARLHMVQMSLLGSQWRGFRGRKWNPLKQRVDARSERRQRPLIKIISAVGFTFVVFLLPTSTVYYAVFVTLRLCLMSIQGLVSLLLWALNSNPVCIATMHFAGSPLLKGTLHLEMQPRPSPSSFEGGDSPSPLRLRLAIRPSPLKEAISASHSPEVFPLVPTPQMALIWNSLVYATDLL